MPDETMTKSEFADHCRVDRSAVSHWIRDGILMGDALVGTGRSARINVPVAEVQLRGRLDLRHSHGNGKARHQAVKAAIAKRNDPGAPPPLPPIFACVPNVDDTTLVPATMLGLLLISELGASAANLALAAGAPLRTAYALKDAMTLATMQAVEGHLATLGLPDGVFGVVPDTINDLDWPARAHDFGEPYDLAAWKAHAAVVFGEPD